AAPAAVVTNDDAGDVTPDENTVVPAAGEVIPAQGQTPAADETPEGGNGEAVAPADGQDGNVLGVVRRPENNGGETVDAVESEGEGEVEAEPESRDTVVVPPTKTEQTTIKTIEDEDVALAAGPLEANAHFSWWWLLLLLVIALTAKYIHDERKKRAAAVNNSVEE
ncbi:MAG: hypothetical protein K6C95_04965, partial [Lachnospiraceae bacterium]|nr:hypothetical protein [Lachnospiraceae bacterium]